MKFPILQIALDFVDLERALKVAKEASQSVDWIEAGTPLIKSEGLESVRVLRKTFPEHTIVADMKVMDAGRLEVESAFKAGAQIVHVLGVASDRTIRESVEAAQNYGGAIIVDLMELDDPVKRAKEVEALGANFVCVHTPIDEQMQGKIPFALLHQIVEHMRIPVAVAGGIFSETAKEAVENGASIVIVGGAITKAEDAGEAARVIKKAMLERKSFPSLYYKRVTEKNVLEAFIKTSTANISDAMHRSGNLPSMECVARGLKLAGKAVTVQTFPGDWAKTVEAIELAERGDVVVIDAKGQPPAVWGELATHSSKVKGVAGVVIYGAIRDTGEIEKLKFPAFASCRCPAAGEPRGYGEINVPIKIEGLLIRPGDWIIGDEDGVVVVPQEKAVDVANRALDVMEKENRLRKEILEGKTLSEVAYLKRWEKVSH